MSLRKAQLDREPAGCWTAGGSGVECTAASTGAGTAGSGLCESQLAGRGVVIKNLGVTPPLDGGFQLAAGFFFAEMLIEEVGEKLFARSRVRLDPAGLFYVAEHRHMGRGGFRKASLVR